MDLDFNNFGFSPNIKLADERTVKAAKKILTFASTCLELNDTDMLDVLMTSLWICVHAKAAKSSNHNAIPDLSKQKSGDKSGSKKHSDSSRKDGAFLTKQNDFCNSVEKCNEMENDKAKNTHKRGIEIQDRVNGESDDDTLDMDCNSIVHDSCVGSDNSNMLDTSGSDTEDCPAESCSNSDTFEMSRPAKGKVKVRNPSRSPVRKRRRIVKDTKEIPPERNDMLDEDGQREAVTDVDNIVPDPVLMLANIHTKPSCDVSTSSTTGQGVVEQSKLLSPPSSNIAEEVLKDLLPDPNQEDTPEKCSSFQSANDEVLSLMSQGRKKRGPYVQYNSEERAKIGRWACEHGPAKTMRLFLQEFGKPVRESTVRYIKKQYMLQCQDKEVKVETLGKKSGHPKLLGEYDQDVVEYVQKLQTSGTLVNRKIVIAGATGILKSKASHLLKENGGHVSLDETWAESLLRRMGFRRRQGDSSPTSSLPQDFDDIRQQFLQDVHSLIDSRQIPDQLVFNVHQTNINIIPSGNWVTEPAGVRTTDSKKPGDKRKVTALLTCSMAGELLPMQVLYQGKTDQCHSRVCFPPDWDVWHSENQSSNDETLLRFAERILIPNVEERRLELGLSSDFPVLVIIDSIDGPKTDAFLQTLSSADISVKFIRRGCASQLEPLMLTGNSQIKEEIKIQFINWYANQVIEEIEGVFRDTGMAGFEPRELKLMWMKPMHAEWMVNAWTRVKEEEQTLLDGWLQSGIKRLMVIKSEVEC